MPCTNTVEEYLHLYGRLFGIRYTIARLTNPCGPGQLRGRAAYGIINRLIQLALADEPLSVYGNGHRSATTFTWTMSSRRSSAWRV